MTMNVWRDMAHTKLIERRSCVVPIGHPSSLCRSWTGMRSRNGSRLWQKYTAMAGTGVQKSKECDERGRFCSDFADTIQCTFIGNNAQTRQELSECHVAIFVQVEHAENAVQKKALSESHSCLEVFSIHKIRRAYYKSLCACKQWVI